jgi:hypothetical protein
MQNDLLIGLRNILLVQIMIMPLLLFQDLSVCVPRSLLKGLASYLSWKSRKRNGEAGETSKQFCEIDMSKFK